MRLGPGECSNVETSARFFAALAFPGVDQVTDRQDAVAAWAGSYLHEQNRVDQTDEPFEDRRLNEFVSLPPRWCKRTMRNASRKLRGRYILARALRPWVQEALGLTQILPPGVDKSTQQKISLWLFNDDGDSANNFRKRVWRPSLPVAHIAIAHDLIFSGYGREQMTFTTNLANVGLIELIVGLARHMEAVVCGTPRFKVAPDELLHFEWVA